MTPQTLSKNASPATDLKARIGSIIAARETGVLLALLVICVFLTFATSSFLTVRNLLNVGRQISLLGIMAIGMTFVLVSREVDLSVGSTYAISGLVTGMLIVR
jgi:ribose transport system permease protein